MTASSSTSLAQIMRNQVSKASLVQEKSLQQMLSCQTNMYVVHTQSPRLARQQGEVHKLVQLLHHLRGQAQQHQQGRRQQ